MNAHTAHPMAFAIAWIGLMVVYCVAMAWYVHVKGVDDEGK